MCAKVDDNFEKDLVEALERQTGLRFGEQNMIPFNEIFPEDFMLLYTEFDSIEAFFEASPWDVEDERDFRAIPDEPFDEYVSNHTDFPSWEIMYHSAGKRFMQRRLE